MTTVAAEQLDIFAMPVPRRPLRLEASGVASIEDRFEAATHTAERFIVLDAIKRVARQHAGLVDQNLVRPLYRGQVDPKIVGSTFRMLEAAELITSVDCAPNRSDDVEGRNAGRWQPTYRWIGAL